MILYIVRHAWAGEPNEAQWPDDGQRPLTDEGIHRFLQVTRRLEKRGARPDKILTSPLLRCVQTAELLAVKFGTPQPHASDALAPGARIEAVIAASAGLHAERLAWVGHAPDVGRWVAELIGGAGGYIDMAKGSVAAIEFDDTIAVGRGCLQWLVTARMLGC